MDQLGQERGKKAEEKRCCRGFGEKVVHGEERERETDAEDDQEEGRMGRGWGEGGERRQEKTVTARLGKGGGTEKNAKGEGGVNRGGTD